MLAFAVVILIIEMIARFHAIEDDGEDVLFPEQRHALLDSLARSLAGSHHQQAGIGMLLQR